MTTTVVPNPAYSALPYQPMRVSVARYHEMIAQGFFAENERFELLEGVIVEKMTKNRPQSQATRSCDLLLSALMPAGWHVQNQEPITLVASEPEPDVAVIRGALKDYRDQHPGIGDIGLVVEVSDTTLTTDRYKARIYAEAGIPIYWIVNLVERVVEVYSLPISAGQTWGYAEQHSYEGDTPILVVLAGQVVGQIRTNDLIANDIPT
jgi:Uma2 family endonuclease